MIPLSTIEKHAASAGSRPALVDDSTSLSWAELADQVRRAVAWLTHHLPRSNDAPRAALLTEGCVAAAVLSAAFSTLKIPWVALDPTSPPNRVDSALDQLAPTIVATQSAGRPNPLPRSA